MVQAKFQHASAEQRRTFRCGECGFEAPVIVSGYGEGAASSFNAPGTLEKRAAQAASKDVSLTFRAAACPNCGGRNPAGVRRWAHYGLPLFFSSVFIAFLGWLPMLIDLNMKERDQVMAGWIMTGIAVFVAIPFLLTTYMKWKGVDARVRFPQDR